MYNANSPYLDKTQEDLLDSLGMTKDEGSETLPTTTGLLFVGNQTALRELPFYEVKYIHYFADGTYKPYEYKGNIIEVAKACFAQLKAEIKQKEYVFGRRGNSPWIAPALLTKYLSTTEHEERQITDSMHLCPQPLYL